VERAGLVHGHSDQIAGSRRGNAIGQAEVNQSTVAGAAAETIGSRVFSALIVSYQSLHGFAD
jgi:hypothetical protein